MLGEDKWKITIVENVDGTELSNVVVTDAKDPALQYKFRYAIIHGIPCHQWCPPSRYEKIDQGIKYRSNDILVSTYPKCGTTWVEQTVLLLKCNNFDLMDEVHKNAYNKATGFGKLWPDAMLFQDRVTNERQFQNMTWEEFDSAPSPRILKCHFPIQILAGSKGQGVAGLPEGMKIVIMSRNPYDACVSGYYHFGKPSGAPFEAYATTFINGLVGDGSYFDWIKGWYAEYKKFPDRIIWMQYENMKKDPFGETQRLAKHLDLPKADDDEFIREVVNLASFDTMTSSAKAKGGDITGHLRKGVVGDWKNHFSPELFELFKSKVEREMKGIEIDLQYE
jgi:hypothetical protein